MKRHATAVWNGSGKEGKGTVSSQSGVLKDTQYSYKSRFEDGVGTNPEELVAAAHAGCFTMKLTFVLGEAGFTPDSLETTSNINFENGVLTESHLVVKGKVPGISKEKFDECVKNPATYDEAKAAMERTHRWLDVCVKSHERPDEQSLFGIVQGSMFEDLRKQSADQVTSHDLPGFAIGGVAVGEDRNTIEEVVAYTTPWLPRAKPRYLMGVGTPWDIIYAIKCGIDMFDCVSPTRLARHGSVFSSQGRISMRRGQYAKDWGPLDDQCECSTCKNHSKAYLHHLMRQREIAGAILMSIHNVHYLINEAQLCRKAILEGTFKEYFSRWSSAREHLERQ